MAVLQSEVARLSLVRISLLFFAVVVSSPPANGQGTPTERQCGEIAHRIACHSVPSACMKNESSEVFEKRDQLDLMIAKLCNNGPKNFSKYYWIDVNGAYRPYYVDKDGNTTKFPPEPPK